MDVVKGSSGRSDTGSRRSELLVPCEQTERVTGSASGCMSCGDGRRPACDVCGSLADFDIRGLATREVRVTGEHREHQPQFRERAGSVVEASDKLGGGLTRGVVLVWDAHGRPVVRDPVGCGEAEYLTSNEARDQVSMHVCRVAYVMRRPRTIWGDVGQRLGEVSKASLIASRRAGDASPEAEAFRYLDKPRSLLSTCHDWRHAVCHRCFDELWRWGGSCGGFVEIADDVLRVSLAAEIATIGQVA